MSFSALFVAASLAAGLPQGLLESVCFIESGHDARAIHHHDGNGTSYGICQVKYRTAQHLGFKGKPQELMNPEVNIEYAARYLAKQLKRYNGNYVRALVSYNRGHSEGDSGSSYSSKVLNYYIARGN